uniref:uncharacterized protein LOC122582635 n=1 Tax=Erigeron canadensis TaxID=72917 RepID=UPI001CB98C77|nr:uncharacterized protein LOC122582635 [Erigeron canadensis]
MMTSLGVTPSTSFTRHLQSPSSLLTHHYQRQQVQPLSGVCLMRRCKKRGSLVVTRGGAPGATTYLFAFLFPLSLLAVTIFTSIQISDKLDRDFYQEMEVNQSILEADDEDLDVVVPTEDEEPPRARTRNRPKREVEVSGM